MDGDRLRALLEAGRSLVSELDSDAVLERMLEVARDLTGARYAAIGVLDSRREGLERFLTLGVSDEQRQAIGDLPHGRGILGVLISDPRPLRASSVAEHPLSYGFPPAHPPMGNFLGVPILLGGEPWGNLYLTDAPQDFSAEDEEVAVVLAEWAAIAIANARTYGRESQQRRDLQRANEVLATTAEVARALGGITELDQVLDLIAKRSRALVGARSAEIALLDGDAIEIAALAGAGIGGLKGARIPVGESLAGPVLATGRAARFEQIPETTFAYRELGVRRAIVMPMTFRSRTLGFLMVFDRAGDAQTPFSPDDERLLGAFAGSAATAVATAQRASDEALRRSLAASEAERRRWARELHDETLQELASIRVMLSGARRSADPQRRLTAIDDAVELLGGAIHSLRALITDLRPAALDELGLEAALEALVERARQRHPIEIELDADGLQAVQPGGHRAEELETTVYRIVQEALNNAIKHARATRIVVRIGTADGMLEAEIRDDGRGFDPAARTSGFGLAGMRERVTLQGGAVDIVAGPGTTITARLPLSW